MKLTTRAVAIITGFALLMTSLYFFVLYRELSQLIFVLSFSGLFVIVSFLYIYEFIRDNRQELDDMNKAIDLTRDYIRDVEKKLDDKEVKK